MWHKLHQQSETADYYCGKIKAFYRVPKAGTYAEVLLNDIRWQVSDCTTVKELDDGEFWKLKRDEERCGNDASPLKPGVEPFIKPKCYAQANDKPVVTKEKCDYKLWDGKENFDIGMAYTNGGGEDCMFIGIHAGIIIGRPLDMSSHNKLYLSTSDKSFCKPIDTRSDEEKIRDIIQAQIYDWGNSDFANGTLVNALLSSDKFTITLNK